jgi:hypothetical protein
LDSKSLQSRSWLLPVRTLVLIGICMPCRSRHTTGAAGQAERCASAAQGYRVRGKLLGAVEGYKGRARGHLEALSPCSDVVAGGVQQLLVPVWSLK